jgi:glutamate-ammonia-ligase adenylyltransferase
MGSIVSSQPLKPNWGQRYNYPMIKEDGILNLNHNSYDEIVPENLAEIFGAANEKASRQIILSLIQQDKERYTLLAPYLFSAMESSAAPFRSLTNFHRFLEAFGLNLFSEIEQNQRLIDILITIFSASPFLTEILIRDPENCGIFNNRAALTERKTIEQYLADATGLINLNKSVNYNKDKLRNFQKKQLLRIGTCDILGLFDLRTVISQLTRMAIALVRISLQVAANYAGCTANGFTVIAMGKLGGWELNYSSDIDLVFVAKNNSERYIHLAEKLIEIISDNTVEGFLYRVDLRLRPWGNDGSLVTTEDGYVEYIQDTARLWEKQAFIKARSIAGDLSLGEKLRNSIEPHLFRAAPGEVRTSILAMKQQTEEILKEKGRLWGEVKLGQGSIRDIEFVVQALQLIHPSIRSRSTLKAITQLQEKGVINADEMHILTDGYIFLRTIEHSLQMIDFRQTDTLPQDQNAQAVLARRLGFEGYNARSQFLERYEQHSQAIREVFMKYVGTGIVKREKTLDSEPEYVMNHILKMDASYSAIFSREEIIQHAIIANQINKNNLAVVNVTSNPIEENQWEVTVVAYDYLGELSIICGLLFVHGFDIIESQIFTYELDKNITHPSKMALRNQKNEAARSYPKKVEHVAPMHRKIVDVFLVRPVKGVSPTPEIWAAYSSDLLDLLGQLDRGKRREARGVLAKRVGEVFQGLSEYKTPLFPIEIDFDNKTSKTYTIIKISTTDTVGFLYEFTNALSMRHINISRMYVQSIKQRAKDTIFVTDEKGRKITGNEMQQELRAATVLIKHFTHLLPSSPNPESALLHFREFLSYLFKRQNWVGELDKMENPEVLNALAKLLGVSDFLWDDFLRMQYANLFPVVRDIKSLRLPKNKIELHKELEEVLSPSDNWENHLNEFKDREMFRIDMRHILGYTEEFWDFASELSDLVEVVIGETFAKCVDDLNTKHGMPMQDNKSACTCVVVALGKCGGRELGFASDIELMFIYNGDGTTTGPVRITTNQFYENLVQSITQAIQARREGIFHIDLQLRPYGKAGSLAVSAESFRKYFSKQGSAWPYERQALVKLRPIAGDLDLGEDICKIRDQIVYGQDSFDVTAMRAMRERQIRNLVKAGTFNAKYSPGGLVDVEYLVQALQITYGGTNPDLRCTNIRMAMDALSDAGLLSNQDFNKLRKAHTFLRWLIDSLRVVRGNSKDVNIPAKDSDEFSYLARRLLYGSNLDSLQNDLQRYPLEVQEMNNRLLLNLKKSPG